MEVFPLKMAMKYNQKWLRKMLCCLVSGMRNFLIKGHIIESQMDGGSLSFYIDHRGVGLVLIQI